MTRAFLLAGALIALGLFVSSCDSASDSATAELSIRMTDAPFPFDMVESVDVTVTRIEVLAAEDDGDADNDTSNTESVRDRIVVFDGEPFALNLLDLRDGVDTLLVDSFRIPADGSYNRLRIFVGDDATVTFNEADGGGVYDLKLPSALQDGIKVALPDYDASDLGDEIDVLIDFNVERSFVTRGNPGSPGFQGFIFKPVLELESFEVLEPGDDDSEDGEDDSEGDASD